MLYLLYFFVLTVTLLYAFRYRRIKKFQFFLNALLFLFLWLFSGWIRGSYDVEIGISRYLESSRFESFTEIGYSFLIEVGHKLNLTYRVHFVIWSLFEVTILVWFINKWCSKPPIVFVMFLLYPMIFYFQYIRNIAAFSIVLIGFSCLVEEKKFSKFIYLLCIAVASTIHFNSIYFATYLLVFVIRKKISKKTECIFVGILSVLLGVGTGTGIFYNVITLFLGATKTSIIENSTDVTGQLGRVATCLAYILLFFVYYFLVNYGFDIRTRDSYSDFLFKINVLSFMFVPLTLNFGVGFARMPILIGLINYIWIVNKISLIKGQKKRVIAYIPMLLVLAFILAANLKNQEFWDLVIKPSFEDNELIQFLME